MKKRIVPYSQMEAEDCLIGLKAGTKHHIWRGFTGDSWPAFCANTGCNTVANDPPPSPWDNADE